MRILVTGAAGQLGAVIVRRFRGAGHEVVATDRQELDITRHEDVMRFALAQSPGAMVNCAAFNDVEGAEDQYDAALDVNAFAVRSLARAARECGAAFVHYSTDFVFDGETSRPYTEADRPRPLSVYGSSKFLGECFARDATPYYVLRVESLFGGPEARSSIDRIAQALEAGREARVFEDRVVSPSFVDDVAAATEQLLARNSAPGTYHCVNSGHATWREVGQEIARIVGNSDKIVPVRVSDVQLKAARPQYAALSNEKLAGIGVRMPAWQDAIARYLRSRPGRG